jgi:para-aminobenzoate synthetase component 1
LGLYDTFVIVDNVEQSAELHAVDLLCEGARDTRRRFESALVALKAAESSPPVFQSSPPISSLRREDYVRKVERALEYIAAGDVFQVNLSQRFETSIGEDRESALGASLRLLAQSPAPFSAFLQFGQAAIVSASPESFYRTQGRRIVTRPIKGTRPRGIDKDRDEALVNQLRESQKDRAELTMIIDLERNDLGRVCEYGSVRVVESHAVESFAQVHHLVATVEGQLRQGVGPVDVVKAVFPGGSITGAPKIRAMQIIDELEENRRGIYTGAIGYFGRGGVSAFNIAIRTLLVECGRVSYQVGGGVVADSDPTAEYEETLHKGRGIFEVLSNNHAAGLDRPREH